MLLLLILIFMDRSTTYCLWEGSLKKKKFSSALSYSSVHGLNCPNCIIQRNAELTVFESFLLGSTNNQAHLERGSAC